MSFAPGIRLELRQQQSLVLTPQLQQAIRLLQMSNLELASAIDQEVAENPFLQRSDAEAAPAPGRGRDGDARGTAALRRRRRASAAAPMPPFRPADCSLSLKRPAGKAFEDDRQPFEDRLTRAKGLREHLGEQVLAMLHDAARARRSRICWSRASTTTAICARTTARWRRAAASTWRQSRRCARAIQRCEPTGVGARDLGECLALQLAEKNRLDPAMATLVANLPLLARADFAELMRRCGVDAEDLQDMIGEIKRLDPRPGLSFAADEPPTLIPDLYVHALEPGRWRVELNGGTLPKVLVDTDYHAELTRACPRSARQGIHGGALPVGQLAGQGARPARPHRAAGGQGDLRAPAGVPGPRRPAAAATRPARHRRGDRPAREHREPGHGRQVRGHPARNLSDQVLLHDRDRRHRPASSPTARRRSAS